MGAKPTVELEGCCPFQEAIDLLSKKHAMTLVWLLRDGAPRRFNDIKRSLGVNPVSLSARLGELETAGVVDRKTFRQVPPRVEYWLTQKGKDLVPLMDRLGDWSGKHLGAPA